MEIRIELSETVRGMETSKGSILLTDSDIPLTLKQAVISKLTAHLEEENSLFANVTVKQT